MLKILRREIPMLAERYSNFDPGVSSHSQEPIEKTLQRLRGSLKGKGVLKALVEERHRESLL